MLLPIGNFRKDKTLFSQKKNSSLKKKFFLNQNLGIF